MAHHHGRMHQLARRQRGRPDEDEEEGVATVISVVFMTMPKTFTGAAKFVTEGPKSAVGTPVQRSTVVLGEPTFRPRPSSARPSASKQSSSVDFDETIKPTGTLTKSASTLMVATSSPLVSAAFGASGLPSASPSASAEAAASAGMSTGAKAGLALGILFGVCAILTGVLFMYARKKKQNRESAPVEDEKHVAPEPLPKFPPPPPAESAPSIRTQRTMSTAPRLSLRPVTQFSPTFAENRKSGGNLLNVSAAAMPRDRTPSPDRPNSSWERPGASNNAATTNPFNDPQPLSASPPQNPFGDAAQTSAPATPQTATYPGPAESSTNLAPAIAAAAVAPVPIRKEVPAPPSIRSEAGVVPPSPAWTEDLPASPGPAPMGPPPVAVPNNVHRVQLDFKPSMEDELGLRAGQLVRMLHEYDDGWALCVRMDRSQQGVVPRTCLSKYPVKPRTGPPRQGPPPGPRMRGPPINSPMGPGGIPQPRPLTPSSGRNSPHPPVLAPANGRMSPGPRSMSPGPQAMRPPQGRARSNSNAPYSGPPRSMSPGPYGGGPQQMPPPKMGRPRSNSASQVMARRASPPGPSPMNPNPNVNMPMPPRKPLPGQAI